MKVAFSCPSCNARFEADAAHAGKPTRCKGCGQRLTVPHPSAPREPEPFADGYDLAPVEAAGPAVFVPAQARGDFAPPTTAERERQSRRRSRRRSRLELPGWARSKSTLGMLLGAPLGMGLVALLVPGAAGVIGLALSILGLFLFLAGYGFGAYMAFTEDSLHGFLFLAVPIYTAYFLISNFDELWPSLAGMFVGVTLIGAGGWLADSGPAAPAEDLGRRGVIARPLA